MSQIPSSDVTMEDDPATMEEDANKIRRIYRNIREKIIENRLQYVDPNSDAIEATLESVENTFRNVKKPREAVSDSHILLELAILGKERIRNVHCEFRSFNNIEFMDKIRGFMIGKDKKDNSARNDSDNDLDSDEEMEEADQTQRSRKSRSNNKNNSYLLTKSILSRFGDYSMNYFRIAPKPTFLLGSLDKEIPMIAKKVRQKRTTEKSSNEELRTKIKELEVNSSEKEVSTTVTEIERIYKILKKIYKKVKGPVCLYEFMIHPKSFCRTIENIFYVSFLVKDGYARIYLDSENLPVIEPILENEPQSFDSNEMAKRKKSNTINVQSMVSLNKLEWKEIIETFNIETPAIPDPPAHK